MEADALFAAVYESLRSLARLQLDEERPDHTLQPTALVNEAFVRLTSGSAIQFNDKAHFFRLAAQAMRRILIDHARARGQAKRDAKLKVQLLDVCETAATTGPDEILSIEEAILRLEQLDGQAAAVVRTRFYLGLSIEETALALGVSVSTVRRDWTYARAFLFRELRDD